MKTADEIWERIQEDNNILVNGVLERLDKATEEMYEKKRRYTCFSYEDLCKKLNDYTYESDWLNKQPEIKNFLRSAGGLILRDHSNVGGKILIVSLPK